MSGKWQKPCSWNRKSHVSQHTHVQERGTGQLTITVLLTHQIDTLANIFGRS